MGAGSVRRTPTLTCNDSSKAKTRDTASFPEMLEPVSFERNGSVIFPVRTPTRLPRGAEMPRFCGMLVRILPAPLLALGVISCVSTLEDDFRKGKLKADVEESDAGAKTDGTDEPTQCPEGTFGDDCTLLRMCMPGSYVVTEGTQGDDAECDGCPSGTFSDEVNATRCKNWTDCEPGQYVLQAGSASSDQVCETCAKGQTSASINAGACYPEGSCPGGMVEIVPGDDETPPECDECEPGFFCAGGSSLAHACEEGTWDHDGEPASNCVDQTTCAVGEFISEPGSALTDRTCENCPQGTFSLEVNAEACQPLSDCEPGTFASSEGDATSDRTCEVCPVGSFTTKANEDECSEWTVCQPREYIEATGTATSDQNCSPCADGEYSVGENAGSCTPEGECPAGTEQTAPASDTTPPDCEACSDGQYCAGGISPAADCSAGTWDHDQNPSTPCANHTLCLPGTHIDELGDNLTDQTCVPCSAGSFSTGTNALNCQQHQDCEAGTYVTAEGSATSDVGCSGCASGRFSSATNASSCSAWTDCQPGQYVSTPGSETSDRTCSDCPSGEYSDSINAGSCVPTGQCPQGTVETEPGTDTTPPVCDACGAGNYCAGGQADEVACGDGTWDDDLDPATPCVSKTTCALGEYVVAGGSPTTNRVCASCDTGEFSDSTNASECTAWQTCPAGKYIEAVGTSTSDRQCTNCPNGRFSSSSNSSSCTPWTTCSAPSHYQTASPSSTSDRTCGACSPPERTSADNQTVCTQPAFQMSSSTVVMEAENYHAKATNGASDSWSLVSIGGISNGAAMSLGPDSGDLYVENVASTAPRLDYYVNFTTTGTFYVHLRGDAVDPVWEADSCWVGVDGVVTDWAYVFDDATNTWGWQTIHLSVDSTGLKTFSVWGREDGFRLDKIVINKSATPPSGNGPDESPVN